MAIEEEELPIDYLSIVKRRWRTILMTALLALIVIIVVSFQLPSVYESHGEIVIESPSISATNVIGENSDANRTAKYVGERLDKIERTVLSRKNLIDINEKYNLYPGLEPAAVDLIMSKGIKIKPTKKSSDGSEWGNQITVGFDVIFHYSEAEKTYKVALELVNQLMEENAKDRAGRATQTTTFLTNELEKLNKELEATENKVAAYKKKHSNSLPEHQQMHMGMLDELRNNIKGLDLEYKNTKEEIRYLDVEYTTTNASLGTGPNSPALISDLDKARAELDRGMVLYKETHPTIRALKRKIALLENNEQNKVSVKPKKSNTTIAAELALAKINSQQEAARVRLNSIAEQKRTLLTKMSRLQAQVVKIPEVETGLFTLLRDYENAKRKYDDVKAKQVNAQIAEKLELGNKSERFILKQSPELPKYRISPKRKNIVGIGLFGSLGLGFGLALLLEFLDKRVRGVAKMASVVGMKPIAVIPYIKTQAELNKQKNLIKYAYIFVIMLALTLLTLACIHFFVSPLVASS